jgi:hypothetical protein
MQGNSLVSFFNNIVFVSVVAIFSIILAADSAEYVIDDAERLKLIRINNNLNKNWIDGEYINWELQESSRIGRKAVVELLLNHTIARLRIQQRDINFALRSAAINDNHDIVELLLKRDESRVNPDQFGINRALSDVVICGLHESMAERLLNRPPGQLVPDKKGVTLAYCDALTYKHRKMIDLLKPRVFEDKIPQASVGGAEEILDNSSAKIDTDNSA